LKLSFTKEQQSYIMTSIAFVLSDISIDWLINNSISTNAGVPKIFFLPIGIRLAFILYFGKKYVPIVSIPPMIIGINHGQPIGFLIIYVINLMALSTFLFTVIDRETKKITSNGQSMNTVQLLIYLICAVLVYSFISGISLYFFGFIEVEQIIEASFQWYIGDMLGIFTVSPLCVYILFPLLYKEQRNQVVKFIRFNMKFESNTQRNYRIAEIGLQILMIQRVFSAFKEFPNMLVFPLYLILVIPIFLMVLRFGIVGAIIGNFTLNLQLYYLSNLITQNQGLSLLQVFMFVISILNLITGVFLSDRRSIEKNIQKTEKVYAELLEFARDGIIITDKNHDIIEINKSALSLFDITKDHAININSQELISIPSDIASTNTTGTASVWETQIIKDAIRIDIEVSFTSFEDGRCLYIIRDITTRKKTEIDLLKSQEMLLQSQKVEEIGKLVGSIAHDFNNLLTAILGYCDLTLLETKESHTAENVSQIKLSSESAMDLAKNILAFSRKQIITPIAIDLNQHIQALFPLLDRIIGVNYHISAELDENLPTILMDKSQLEQVLMNLIINSKEAMPNGGEIKIHTSSNEKTAILSVIDQGIGMSEEQLEMIFEPFYSTKPNSSGLGMMIVNDIVKKNKAKITISSKVGKGTRFDIEFPLTNQEIIQPKEEEVIIQSTVNVQNNAIVENSSKSSKILVIDDEPAIRELISRVLSFNNYEVYMAENGEEARSICQLNADLDLIISDVILGMENGFTIVREILQDLNPHVLMISGYLGHDNQSTNIGKHYTFLQKPFSTTKLMSTVENLLTKNNKKFN